MAAGVILIMGPPGAGKSSQARLLGEKPGFTHISTGDLVRGSGDVELLRVMNRGDLIDSERMQEMLHAKLVSLPEDKVVVLDGFPRGQVESEWLTSELVSLSRELTKVIYLVVDPIVSQQRNKLRGRLDDAPEAQQVRWREWREQTEPVLENFRRLGWVTEIDGTGTAEAVARRVADATGA